MLQNSPLYNVTFISFNNRKLNKNNLKFKLILNFKCNKWKINFHLIYILINIYIEREREGDSNIL